MPNSFYSNGTVGISGSSVMNGTITQGNSGSWSISTDPFGQIRAPAQENGDLPKMTLTTSDEQGNLVRMTLTPESSISTNELSKIMMLLIAVQHPSMSQAVNFNALMYVKNNGIERHFTYS